MTPEEALALRERFPDSAIGHKPKGGIMLDFVGHAATTDRLLKVDPEWSWEPFALDDNGLPAIDAEGNLWIKLTVCGVTRPGVGDGPNAKERIGDAIRNAAMRFGVALDLWAREDIGDTTNGEVESILERQKARIQARQQVSGASSPAGSTAGGGTTADATNAPASLKPTAGYLKPTTRQLKNLNRLAGTLRDQGSIETMHLWVAIANARNVDVDVMIHLLGGRDEEGELHWSPLRDDLTRKEASDLIDRLERFETNITAASS